MSKRIPLHLQNRFKQQVEPEPEPAQQEQMEQNNQIQEPVKQPENQQKLQRKGKKNSKIDTDLIPRPYQSSESSYNPVLQNYGSIVLASQIFNSIDQGCAGARHIRSTMNNLHQDQSQTKQTNIPLVQPFAEMTLEEDPIQIINKDDVFRCSRCRAYVNPNFVFKGNSAICNLCKMVNQVPEWFQSGIDASGVRYDKYEKPELHRGIYEFVVPKDYYGKRDPKQFINIMLCLELSRSSIQSGLIFQTLQSLKQILDNIQSPERTQICIMTFDSNLTFYNLPNDLSKEPQVVIVQDLDDASLPLPHELLFKNLQNDRPQIDYLIEKIQKISYQLQELLQECNSNSFSPLGSVLHNVKKCFENSPGRAIIFACQPATIGLGKIKQRPQITQDKEKTLFVPQNNFFQNLGQELLDNRVCVDLFLAPVNKQSIDIVTYAPVCQMTGGEIHYFPEFNQNNDAESFHYKLQRILTRETAYDCVMTVRLSEGLILQEYYTGREKVQTRDLEMSAIDSDKTISILFKQEDKIPDQTAHLQYAILYTNTQGERVVRVINYQFQISSDIMNVFKSADIDCLFQLLIKQNVSQRTELSLQILKQNLVTQLVNIFYSYRINQGGNTSLGQLILPEAVKLFPIMLQSLFKQKAYQDLNDCQIDEKFLDIYKYLHLPVYCNHLRLYPQLYSFQSVITNQDSDLCPGLCNGEYIILPQTLPLEIEKLFQDEIYIIDDSESIFIFITPLVSEQLIQEVFGVNNKQELEEQAQFMFDENEETLAGKFGNIVQQLRKKKYGYYQRIQVIVQHDCSKLPNQILRLMVEDEIGKYDSYGDFLIKLHRLILEKDS